MQYFGYRDNVIEGEKIVKLEVEEVLEQKWNIWENVIYVLLIPHIYN